MTSRKLRLLAMLCMLALAPCSLSCEGGDGGISETTDEELQVLLDEAEELLDRLEAKYGKAGEELGVRREGGPANDEALNRVEWGGGPGIHLPTPSAIRRMQKKLKEAVDSVGSWVERRWQEWQTQGEENDSAGGDRVVDNDKDGDDAAESQRSTEFVDRFLRENGFVKPRSKPKTRAEPASEWTAPEQLRKIIPTHWRLVDLEGHGREPETPVARWVDPRIAGNSIQVFEGHPKSVTAAGRVARVEVRKWGKRLGRDGIPLEALQSETREPALIPLEEYVKWPKWDSPSAR